jgi:peptidoglycan/LPS O-acetylase OafA/YrhL
MSGNVPGVASKPRFRPDIEGLRAVAVLPVLAYHVSPSMAPGGFVGVDVFFVISGYLISQLLCADIERDRFTIVGFYERRIRRIFPALMAMLAVTFILAWRYCLPGELIDLSRSTMAAALSVSNIYFWMTSGYFSGDELSKPLLHTWSLAVEEQFYLVWPLFLYAGRRYFNRWLIPLTWLLAAISFLVAAVGAFYFANQTFFAPYTRLWELAAGGLLAMGALPETSRPFLRNVLATAGFALIAGSVFLIHATMPFPGLLALPPVAGAGLIILAGRGGDSLVYRGLALKPIAFIGAISYSLYLWHWPINTFQRNYAFLGGYDSWKSKVLICVVSIAVAALSWRFIEQPFRQGKLRPSNRTLLKLAAAATGCIVGMAGLATARDGLPSRFSTAELATVQHLVRVTGNSWRSHQCFLFEPRVDTALAPECLAIDPDRKNILLLGDSHAAQLWKGLNTVFDQVNWLQATASDCLPTIIHRIGERITCSQVLDDVMRNFLTRQHVDNVFLIARWKNTSLENVAATLDYMKANHIPVTLVGPTALYDAPIPRLVISAMRASDPSLLGRHMDPSMADLDGQMRKLAADHGVPYISLLQLQCTSAPCPDGPWPELSDQEHFNALGAEIIARKIRDSYETISQR